MFLCQSFGSAEMASVVGNVHLDNWEDYSQTSTHDNNNNNKLIAPDSTEELIGGIRIRDEDVVASRLSFNSDHARWVGEHERLINDLRLALNSHVGDTHLNLLVDGVVSHYDELCRIKSSCAKSDMFHILSGSWRSPVERCFMWLGGFRSSDLLKVVVKKIQPLTAQQLVGIFNLQQESQEEENALSKGMVGLRKSLVDTLGPPSDYMSQMATAMTKIATIEGFINKADLLRLQIIQQLQRILTTRQAARALLAINDYNSRLRALSSLWVARPE